MFTSMTERYKPDESHTEMDLNVINWQSNRHYSLNSAFVSEQTTYFFICIIGLVLRSTFKNLFTTMCNLLMKETLKMCLGHFSENK